jgi:hypothetical protein
MPKSISVSNCWMRRSNGPSRTSARFAKRRRSLPNGDDEHVFLVEKWRDQEALDEHAKGPMPGATYRDWIVGRKVARGAPAD